MYEVIVVRCASGTVVWDQVNTSIRNYTWTCVRDGFKVPMPESVADVERVLLAIAQHSVQLAGALQQVVELNI